MNKLEFYKHIQNNPNKYVGLESLNRMYRTNFNKYITSKPVKKFIDQMVKSGLIYNPNAYNSIIDNEEYIHPALAVKLIFILDPRIEVDTIMRFLHKLQ